MKRAKSRRRPATHSTLESLGASTRKVGTKVKRTATKMLRSLGEATKVMQSRPPRRRPAR